MSTRDTLGFGIVGAGMIAPFHANSLRHARGGRLAAVCDVDRARAEKLITHRAPLEDWQRVFDDIVALKALKALMIPG